MAIKYQNPMNSTVYSRDMQISTYMLHNNEIHMCVRVYVCMLRGRENGHIQKDDGLSTSISKNTSFWIQVVHLFVHRECIYILTGNT